MPCYDKKLEAARDDFIFTLENTENGDENPGLKIVEVDSVLTTGEVLDLIQVMICFYLFVAFISCEKDS